MAKRANPYAEDYVAQSKVYIDMKQILNNNESKLNKIYEKTMELLFLGAKKSGVQTPGHAPLVAPAAAAAARDNMKQLCIGKDGSLLHTGAAMVEKHSLKQCVCGEAPECQCAYCEAVLCCSCQLSCIRCQKLYCSRCLLIGSEDAEVCLSCYS